MSDRRDEGGTVGRTLEERTIDELDDLYRGALFLCAGNASAAEALLVETVTTAVPGAAAPSTAAPSTDGAAPGGSSAPEPSLEGRLVRTFLAGSKAGRWGSGLGKRSRSAPAPAALLAAAGEVPPAARAALWLVTVQRRSYSVAAERIGVDAQAFRLLLQHRGGFMAAASSFGGPGERRAGGEA